MTTTISFNKIQLFKKLITQLVFVVVFVFAGILLFNPWGAPLDAVHFLLRMLLFIILVFFNVYVFIQLLYLPIGVSFNDSLKKIDIKFLLIQSKNVPFADITGYGSTMVYTKSKDHEGLLIHLKTGKTILLSNFNLKDYKPVDVFFKKSKIKHLGNEDFSFIPYYRQWLGI